MNNDNPCNEELIPDSHVSWVKQGLRFQCTECGQCCTGSGSYVFLSQSDVDRLASAQTLSASDFIEQYTQTIDDRIALVDQTDSAKCIFLKDNRCSVYAARPVQCRTFPWWTQLLQSPRAWEQASKYCEGINHPDAPLVPLVTIEEQHLTYLDNVLEQNFSHDR